MVTAARDFSVACQSLWQKKGKIKQEVTFKFGFKIKMQICYTNTLQQASPKGAHFILDQLKFLKLTSLTFVLCQFIYLGLLYHHHTKQRYSSPREGLC